MRIHPAQLFSVCIAFTRVTDVQKQSVTHCNALALSIMLDFGCNSCKFLATNCNAKYPFCAGIFPLRWQTYKCKTIPEMRNKIQNFSNVAM